MVCCMLVSLSCKKILDVEPEDAIDITNHYRNINDANAAVIGIYGQLMTIADRYMVLNELRADLMSTTRNADRFLREINTHNVSADNPWADPKPFYKIILNCNDALKNFDIMVKDARIRQEEYTQRYADVAAVRAWLYLQVGIHWGEVPYVTDPLSTIDELKDQSKYPKLAFNDLLDKLIATLENGYLGPYTSSTATGANSNSLITTVDGYSTSLFFINKRIILGDLYLWRGRYTDAARQFRLVSDQGWINGPSTNSGWVQYKATYTYFNVSYSIAGDATTLVDDNTNTASSWRSIFGATAQSTDTNSEWAWMLPFDKNFTPGNPFIDLFSSQGGRYLLTASQYALDKWNSQIQNNGIPYDARGLMSVRTVGGQRTIMKPLYQYLTGPNFTPLLPFQKQGKWLLYRSATINQRFAEAACRDNYLDVGYALVNEGITNVFSGVWPAAITNSNIPTNRTNIMITNRPAPYDLDGRNGEVPYFRSAWYKFIGVRSRAGLQRLPTSLINNAANSGGNQIELENAIIEENALEMAFEGQRWGDILRVALRRGDLNFVADKVYEKLRRDGAGADADAAKNKLSTLKGIYLPFKL